LVVDGTQAFEFEDVNNCDYWVMSTHKWLGNIKTAGFLIYKENA
jgi:selenocysteine lyase/cysteine desulfurase